MIAFRALLLVAAFKKLDAAESGFIAAEELKRLVRETKADIAEERLEELIRKCSPGPDGRIRFEDFMAALVAHLRR